MSQMTYKDIISDFEKGSIAPVYFLYGDEPFFIDLISDYIEEHLLTEAEKGFNQMVLYGRDISIDEIISNAKRFPMMAERQVIIVKEAQDLSRSIHQIEDYLDHIVPTTVLVLNYKYKKPDKRKSFYKKLVKKGVVFESKPLYENQVPQWISQYLKSHQYGIEPKASLMLVEYLGTQLSKISNELHKLMIILPKETLITPTHIEENIGISKDFNNFELRKAIGTKNVVKANQIINYFAQNPNQNPAFMSIALLNSFFTQLLQLHTLPNKHDKRAVASLLKINPYFADEYIQAAKLFPMKKVSHCIALLREADLKLKGVGNRDMPQKDIMRELVFKLLH